jgi:hypothetical protein
MSISAAQLDGGVNATLVALMKELGGDATAPDVLAVTGALSAMVFADDFADDGMRADCLEVWIKCLRVHISTRLRGDQGLH